MRMEAVGRIELSDKDASRLSRMKVVHVTLVVVLVLVVVVVARIVGTQAYASRFIPAFGVGAAIVEWTERESDDDDADVDSDVDAGAARPKPTTKQRMVSVVLMCLCEGVGLMTMDMGYRMLNSFVAPCDEKCNVGVRLRKLVGSVTKK